MTDLKTMIAFAVNDSNSFEKKHFGDADKYVLYQYVDENIITHSEEINKFKDYDEEKEHGSKLKGQAIIDFLKSKDVKVLVSKQFGRNIKMVNRHFVPVITSKECIVDVIPVLKKHINLISDELNKDTEEYKLFDIRNKKKQAL